MSTNRFGHIDLRVARMEEALPFYSALLPALGFTRTFTSGEWTVFVGAGEPPEAPYIGVTEERDHRPNNSRIAFWASSREEVDRLAEIVRRAGGRNIQGPKDMPYSVVYYAVYFDDPSGNRLEIYFQKRATT